MVSKLCGKNRNVVAMFWLPCCGPQTPVSHLNLSDSFGDLGLKSSNHLSGLGFRLVFLFKPIFFGCFLIIHGFGRQKKINCIS